MYNPFYFFIFLILFSTPIFANIAKVAIVIDDIGYRQTDKQALTLPGRITFSILPHTPFGLALATEAHKNDNEILLHIPMESKIGKKLGPAAITSEMNEQAIHDKLALAFNEIPFATGINNHMGSYLTQLYPPMAATMRYLKANNRIFLDSKTTSLSRGEEIAKAFGVPTLHRHVFLDNHLTEAYISGQFQQLINIAKKHGKGVAIAHPHPETIRVLKKLIPKLKQHTIELVNLSDLLETKKIKTKSYAITAE